MANLSLRVHKYLELDGDEPPEVPARLIPIDSSGRRRLAVVNEFIPVSDQPSLARKYVVDPGSYFVEVALPSGEVLTDHVLVPMTGMAELVLVASGSPNEWLSWQHLVGNVPTKRPQASSRRLSTQPSAPRSGRRKGLDEIAFADSPVRSRGSSAGPEVLALPEPSEPLDLGRPILHLAHPPAELQAVGAWRFLANLQRSPAMRQQVLIDAQAIKSAKRSPDRAIFRVSDAPTVDGVTVLLRPGPPRKYLVVADGSSFELLCLPLPWVRLRSSRPSVIEVVVQRRSPTNSFVSSIGVHDEQLGLLLGYLSSGAMERVRQVADAAKDLLYGKTVNPLGAAAGAYAMVGTAYDSEPHEWHQWVRNLSDWNQQLPDAAIILAQLQLRTRRGIDDVHRAGEHFKRAFQLGLPYFALGMRWLLDGLEKVGQHDREAASMAKDVAALASRINPLSAFTIIQLGSR